MQSMQLRASLSLDLENLVGHYCLLHRLHVDAQVKVSKGSKSWRKTKQGVSGWSTLVGCKKQATCPTTTRLKRWEVAQQSLGGGVTTHWSKVWEKLLHTGESKADISPTASSQYSFFSQELLFRRLSWRHVCYSRSMSKIPWDDWGSLNPIRWPLLANMGAIFTNCVNMEMCQSGWVFWEMAEEDSGWDVSRTGLPWHPVTKTGWSTIHHPGARKRQDLLEVIWS